MEGITKALCLQEGKDKVVGQALGRGLGSHHGKPLIVANKVQSSYPRIRSNPLSASQTTHYFVELTRLKITQPCSEATKSCLFLVATCNYLRDFSFCCWEQFPSKNFPLELGAWWRREVPHKVHLLRIIWLRKDPDLLRLYLREPWGLGLGIFIKSKDLPFQV